MNNRPESDSRRWPSAEPEIIPPGQDIRDSDRMGSAEAYFFRFGDGSGVHRFTIARPGLPSILFGLLILGAALAVVLVLLVGLVLLLPVVIGAVALALVFGALGRRGRW